MKTPSRAKRAAAALTATLLFSFIPDAPLCGASRVEPDSEFREIAKGIDLFGDIYRELSVNYVEPLDVSSLMYAAIDGMLAALDPYTVFLDESQSEELGELTSGQYTGIGISMARFGEKIYVTSVLDGYPAGKAGIRTGDRIEMINSRPVRGKTLDEIREMIKGTTGTRLTMKIEREGGHSPGVISLSREEVRVSTVSYSGIIGRTGYIELSSFTSHSTEDIREAVEKLLRKASADRQPMNGLVFDLRGNPGGLLASAVEISSLFVENGSTVVTIRGRASESEKIYKTEHFPLAAGLPLAVLINRESASASEIVSGAIQDLDRGIVLGERSYGKGLVQSVVRLPYDNTLKLTTAKYYTPSGRLIQKPRSESSSVRDVLKKNHYPESLPVYYTTGKRKVYGGGGIAPDVTVQGVERSEYEQELRSKGLIFLFASRYRATHPEAPEKSLEQASLMEAFAGFLLEEKFSFTSAPERRLMELEESIKAEQAGNSGNVTKSLEGLKLELAELKRKKIEGESKRIARLLELEIMRHYNETASRKAELADDPVLQKALALLSDTKAYLRMLRH
ncbi:MAG: S41 family peptidase [Chlorobium sp.]|uniref:S41 family peptidase n=1 Tax=Chlorobium sp. TaxID=1095 RepID=UPI0025BCB59D|nr:S41 family peptidase [Chlorobium sp.]MCF8382239.1 S41 family peptidase [Chlorobium sp.]